MNYVKILFRSKEMKPIHISLDKWEKMISDPSQIIKYTLPEETIWSGRTFNKADIVGSEPDYNYKVPDVNKYDYYINKETKVVVKLPLGVLPEKSGQYHKM